MLAYSRLRECTGCDINKRMILKELLDTCMRRKTGDSACIFLGLAPGLEQRGGEGGREGGRARAREIAGIYHRLGEFQKPLGVLAVLFQDRVCIQVGRGGNSTR